MTPPVPPPLARLVDTWIPDTAIPDDLAERVDELRAAVEASLQPADIEAVAVLIYKAVAQFDKPDADQFEAFVDQTVGGLKALPLDIIEAACQRVVETHKYRTMPTTATFLDKANGEHRIRLARFHKLDIMARRQRNARQRVERHVEADSYIERIMSGGIGERAEREGWGRVFNEYVTDVARESFLATGHAPTLDLDFNNLARLKSIAETRAAIPPHRGTPGKMIDLARFSIKP